MKAISGIFLIATSLAGCIYQSPLPNPTAVEYDRMGATIALNDNHLLTGTPSHDYIEERSGKMNYHHFDGVSWNAMAPILSPEPAQFGSFAHKIDMDESGAIIAAQGEIDLLTGEKTGAVYIDDFSGGQVVRLTGPENSTRGFGRLVSKSGNVIAVAATDIDKEYRVFIYRLNKSTGIWDLEATLLDPETGGDHHFGNWLSIDGSTLAAGAEFDDETGTHAGAAHLYSVTNGNWAHNVKLTAFDGEAFDEYGSAIDLKDNLLVIGAKRHDVESTSEAGAVYVYERNEMTGDWLPTYKATAFDKEENASFGKSVAVDRDSFLVGAPGSDAAYFYRKQDSGWVLAAKLMSENPQNADFGYAVDLHKDCAAVSAPQYDSDSHQGPVASGASFVFCDLPQVSDELPQFGVSIDCCDDSSRHLLSTDYRVHVDGNIDKRTALSVNIEITDPNGRTATIDRHALPVYPGDSSRKLAGTITLDSLHETGTYRLSIYVSDETGQTQIAHQSFKR